ncbi:MAG: hypothetical protein RRA32_05985, partial [bacterium]|nr:hypothetical protein [bacterium]
HDHHHEKSSFHLELPSLEKRPTLESCPTFLPSQPKNRPPETGKAATLALNDDIPKMMFAPT